MRIVDDPTLDATISEGMVDIHQLSEEELRRFNMWLTSVIQAHENAYYQFRVGMFDKDRWRMHRAGLKGLLQQHGTRQWWKMGNQGIATLASLEFVALVEEILGEETGGEGG